MRALAVTLLALLTLAAPAAAQDVARLDRPTPISAHGGWLAWSQRGADGLFALTLRDPQGVVTTAPIAGRTTPFDVDLGPGLDGLVAAYSRCREEVASPGAYLPADLDEGNGCDVYRLEIASGTELRVNGVSTRSADETWPTVWRDRIAFVRSYDNKPTLPYIYARPLAGGASERLPGGTRNVCSGSGRRVTCTDERVSRPYALDLYGKRLAFGWTYAGRSEGLDTEIRLDTIGGGHTRIAYQAGGGLTGRALGWPSFESGRVYFSSACYADTGGCVGRPELLRYRISTATTQGAQAEKAILAHERESGTDWLLLDQASGTDCQGDPAAPGGTCLLTGIHRTYR